MSKKSNRNRFSIVALTVLLVLVACGGQEEVTPTSVPATNVPATATQEATAIPEPTATPTLEPATATPLPTETPEPASAETDPPQSAAGYWEGAIDVNDALLQINVEFTPDDAGLIGTIDIPEQGAFDLPLENIVLDGDQIQFEIAGLGAVFDGVLSAENIMGDFTQGAATGTFELNSAEKVVTETVDVADLPYIVEEVEWAIDDTIVEGTLTLPEGDGLFPAVIMVAGSGPTDRNWNSPLLPGTNGSAALFADALTRAGYATLRFDKRASGPNVVSNMEKMLGELSMQSHLDEVAGGIALLADNEAIDADRIFALGNSEGTLHALNYQRQATDTPLVGLILAAPPGRALQDVLHTQLAAQMATLPNSEGLMELFDEAVARFVAGEPMNPSPELPEGVRQLLLGFEAPVNLPFTRELLVADPAEWLAEVDVPVLVLIGKKDIQIDWELDGQPLEAAVADKDTVTFVYPENANHVFKYEEKSAETLTANDGASYNLDGRVLDDESLEIILDWLAGLK